MNRCLLLLLSSLTLLASCRSKKSKEDLLAADQQALDENLHTARVRFYKFFKLIVRASADTTSSTYRLFGEELRGYSWAQPDDSQAPAQTAQRAPGVRDYVNLYRIYRAASPIIDTCHEDGLPPFLPALLALREGKRTGPAKLPEFEAIEHIVLSMAAYKAPQLGSTVALYEGSQPTPAHIPDEEIGSLAQLFQGFLYQREELLYLSEAKLLANLRSLDKAGPHGLPLVNEFIFENKVAPERSFAAYRALHHMLLAMTHRQMEDKAAAVADLDNFRKDAVAAGLPNELVQRVNTLLDEPAEAKRAATFYLLSRFTHLAAKKIGAPAGDELLQRALTPVQQAISATSALSRETLDKGTHAVKEKSGELWEKAKRAVR